MAFIPNDTLFASQWHLQNTTPGEYDLNVVDVWDDYDGSGVRVAVLDRGFDYDHSEFTNYRADLDWDFRDNDPFPRFAFDPDLTDDDDIDSHGTPALGIIGAAQDGLGTVGIAFGAETIGYRTNWERDQVEAAIDLATADNHDIITMSYGESAGMFIQRETLVQAAEDAAENGRDGLGLIIVKSAGNSRRDRDSIYREETTGEALENSRHTIVVAGVSDTGEVPPIFDQLGDPNDDNGNNKSSSPGANVLTTAFYGREGDSVQTTDISGSQGYNSNPDSDPNDGINDADYTGFTGTSAAAPQVAGVIALILDANPNLGWRDVQDIIAYSSRHIGSDVGDLAEGEEQGTQSNGATWFWNAAQNWNGGGLHFSNDYGFGLIDAKAAVRLAETWSTQKTSANEVTPAHIDALDSTVTIADGSTSGGSNFYYLTFDEGIEIENITLGISFIEVAHLGDLEIYLTSPGGTSVQLIADTGDTEDWSGYWRFGSTAFRGESSEGRWQLQIRDDDNAVTSPITIADIDLWTHGAHETNDDLFIFTDEYATYAGVDGHTTNFVGGVGHDVINAAAMDNWIIVDLQSGQGAIGGHVVTMSGIEEVFGGDNHDVIYDGAGANELWGGRGNDTLRDTTAGGNDVYHGNQGYDTFEVYSAIGGDSFFGGAGRDRIDWSQSSENTATFDLVAHEARDADGNVEEMRSIRDLIGTAQGDTIIENGAANDIDGHGGNDTFIMTSNIRNDSFRGGAGRDTIDWSAATENGATFDLRSGEARDTDGHVEQMESFENLIGTDNNDIIIENSARNIIDARGGDDIVRVNTVIGTDSFTGGFGNDTIDWSGSAQVGGVYDISGGTATDGADVETMFGFENFFGTNQSDTIIEGTGANAINAGAGNDTVRATSSIGHDSIAGGNGIDTIDWSGSAQSGGLYDLSSGLASAGSLSEAMVSFENIIGTNQADTIVESSATNVINAGGGNDYVWVNTVIGLDSFTGGSGNDTIDWSGSSQTNGVYDISGGTASLGGIVEVMFGFENFVGTNQADRIIEGAGINFILGGGGNDIVEVNTLIGSDSLNGGTGIDTADWSGSLQENGIYDLQNGTASAGRQTETMSNFENLTGTELTDTIRGSSANNELRGRAGNDDIYGRAGNDHVLGGIGDDNIRGNGGADTLEGGAGDDFLRGGGGADFLTDGTGQDLLVGQNGNDVFDFGVDQSVDRIGDFSQGADQIRLAGFEFADLTISDLASGHIRVLYGDDRLIIQDSANLLSAADLTSSDFLFV